MPRAFVLALSLLGAPLAAGSDAATPMEATSAPYRAVQNPGTLGYLLHLPEGYDEVDAGFPLLFFLHGIIQKGTGSIESLEKVADHGPFRTMRDGHWERSLPLIVVGPQSTGLQPWWRGEEVRRVLEHVRTTYRVDERRVYLSGISMGGRGIWWLARNFPSEFAAIVPVSAWSGDLTHACDLFRPVGIWAFHGDRDPLIRLASGRRPIDTLAACTPPFGLPPHLTVLRDAGHGQWSRVYDTLHQDANLGADRRSYRDIYRWMLSFSR